MKIGPQKKVKILSAVIIVIVALFTFKDIPNIFFQQDEWLGLGGAITRSEEGGLSKVFHDTFASQEKGARILPVTSLVNYIVFTTFKTNTDLYGIFSLVLVLISSLIINLTLQKLTKSFLISLIVSLLWLTNNLSLQAVTLIGAIIPSQFAFLFFSLSFYCWISFLQTPKQMYFLWISVLAMTFSLGAKEIGVFYILVFPLLIWLFPLNLTGLPKKISFTFFLAIPLFVALVLPQLLWSTTPKSGLSPSLNPSSTTENVILNAFLIPARSLGQMFIPTNKIYPAAYFINKVHYTNYADGFLVETIIADTFSLLVSFYVLLIIFAAVIFARSENKKLITWSLFAFLVSLLPFILFADLPTLLEPRYFIFPALWAGMIFTSVVYSFFGHIPRIGRLLTLVAVIPILFINITGVQKAIGADIETGHYRKEILETVSQVKPRLQNDNIFFFARPSGGFFEFQSGFGQTLAVWLYDSGKIPRGVLTDRAFWELDYEGIKDYSGKRYGYFMYYDKLLAALKANPDFPLEGVYSFLWDSQNHKVTNVSDEVREKLKHDLGVQIDLHHDKLL